MKFIPTLKWWHWKLTGYRELSELIRAHSNPRNALTPVGLKRLEELADKEGELRRGL